MKCKAHQRGSVLVGVLWCLVILSAVVISELHTARIDLMIAKNQTDQVRAHYLALAGVEHTKAILFHHAYENRRSGKGFSPDVFNDEIRFKDIAFAGGQYRIFRSPKSNETETVVYGVSDEESRLNINQASAEELAKLPGMTPQLAACIVDYRDPDSNVSQGGGAEEETYAAMNPPYLPRNGPFETTTELLSVAGMTRRHVLGEDENRNGLLDPDEDNGDATEPIDNQNGVLDAGLSGLTTIASSSSEVNARGEARLDITTATQSDFEALDGITSTVAKAIVDYREQNNFSSIADLLEVRAMQNQEQGRNQQNNRPDNNRGGGGTPGSSNRSTPTGEPLISKSLLIRIADEITSGSETSRQGSVNINTADQQVLQCLPGLDERSADAILRYRFSNGYFENIAEILNVPEISTEVFKQLAPRICVRSETFRILSEGKSGSSGARKRIQVLVRVGASKVETLSYREDL